MSLLTLLQPLALVLIVLVIVLEIRRLRYQVFHIIVTLHKADSVSDRLLRMEEVLESSTKREERERREVEWRVWWVRLD